MDVLPVRPERLEHRIHCEVGHVRRPEKGTETTFCPECIERRIRARIALGMPYQHLLGLLRIADPPDTLGS